MKNVQMRAGGGADERLEFERVGTSLKRLAEVVKVRKKDW